MDKEMDYDNMQQLDLMKLREEAERCIKPRSEDPMKRTAHRKIDSIPNLSQSVFFNIFSQSARKSFPIIPKKG
jgi:hypothetical protein